MFSVLAALVVQLRNAFADRRDLLLENAALRHQLAIYQRKANRPHLTWESVIARALRLDPGLVGVAIAAIAAAVWFSRTAMVRWNNFWATEYDLGILDQLVYNTAHGRWFESSTTSYNFFGQHMQPILVVWAAAYRLFDAGPQFLIISQAVAAAAAAPVLYLAMRRFGMGRGLSVVVALTYLLNPYLHRALNYDFHPEATLVLPAFGAAWAIAAKRYWLAGGLALSAILFKEDAVFVTLALAAVLWWYGGRKQAYVTGGLALGWTFLVIVVIMPWIRGGSSSDLVERYGYLVGTSSQAEFLPWILVHPWVAVQYLVAPHRLWTMFLFVGVTAPLAVLRPKLLPFVLPGLAVAVLSMYGVQRELQLQYAVEVVPVAILIGALGALFAVRRISPAVVAMAIVAPAIVGYIQLSPLSPKIDNGHGPSAEHRAALMGALAEIPNDPRVSVSAQSGLTPRVSQRDHIYEFPRNALESDWVITDKYGVVSGQSGGPADFDKAVQDIHTQLEQVYDRDGVEVFRHP